MNQINRKQFELWAIIITIISTFVALLGIFPYSSGYRETYRSLAVSINNLYHWDNGEWIFGYAIVPIVGILLWLTRDRFRNIKIRPTYFGLAVIIFALLVYYAGHKANEKYLGFAACQILVAGLVLWFLGWQFFKKLFWLWILLAMVWPIIPLIPMISFPMRMMVTKITVVFLNLIGVETVQNGTALLSAATETLNQGDKFSLQVAAPCSGLRSLMALFMICLGLLYYTLEVEWKRMILLFGVFPLAILGNFIRLLILLVGTLFFGSEIAIGKGEHDPSAYHLGAGFLVYIIAVIGLLALQRYLVGGRKKIQQVRKKAV